MVEFYLLNIIMILGALLAIWVRNLVAAAISMGIIGYTLALNFLFLGAPDLAIVQTVVETMTLIILLSVIMKTTREDTGEEKRVSRIIIYICGVAFFAIFIISFVKVMNLLPPFGEPNLRMASYYIEKGLDATGAPNLVGAIILNLRGYDTLGEATVLFTSVVGLVVVLRAIGRKNYEC